MKNLISMTDFALEQGETSTIDTDQGDWYCMELEKLDKIREYAKFLKQKLELWMFVPCDENGNVLEVVPYYADGIEKVNEYKKAKGKVIFDGFDIIHNDKVRITIECNHFQLDFNKPLNHFENYKTIEDLPINLDCVVSF